MYVLYVMYSSDTKVLLLAVMGLLPYLPKNNINLKNMLL